MDVEKGLIGWRYLEHINIFDSIDSMRMVCVIPPCIIELSNITREGVLLHDLD